MEGWIKLHRQIEENELWFSEKFTKAQAWVDLLLLARHKEGTLFIRGVEIRLKPGELCRSQISLAKRWKWNFKTVKKFLTDLKNREMVETKITNVTTIISIKKWWSYQVGGEQNGEQKESKTETNKNGKNVNIELARMLIKKISKEPSLYSIVAKYKNNLGEDKLKDILADCIKRGNEFGTESNLASYLEACTKTNGKSHHSFNPIEVKQ